MATDTPSGTIKLEGVDFSALAKQVVAEKILEGFAKSDEMVRAIVVNAITERVGEDGRPSSYNHNTSTWLEYIVKQHVREVTKAAVIAKIEEMRPALEKSVAKALREGADRTGQALVLDFVERIKDIYSPGVKVDVTLQARQKR